MARRRYVHCSTCKQLVLASGEPQLGDICCPHRFSRIPIEPTVYYVNAAGKRLYPWDSRKLPKQYTDQGYERVELSGLGDIRRFERETGKQLANEHSRTTENEAMISEYKRDQRQASLRNDMSRMDDFMKEVARLAMDDENRGQSDRYDPEFFIQAYN